MDEIKQIDHYKLPPVGEIIRTVRLTKEMSQEDLAAASMSSRSAISQIELGLSQCQDYLLVSIKKALDIEHLPTSEAERNEFRKKLHRWYDVISNRKQDEATEVRGELSVIKFLPCDKELNILFSLFDCRFHLLKNELDAAKEIMDVLEVDGFSDIQMYHYLCNQGTYYFKRKSNQEALDFYLKAYDLMNRGLEKSITLYFNIAVCYERLGYVSRAANLLEEACAIFSQGQCDVPEFALYSFLGGSYACIGLLQRAQVFLDKAYSIAECEYKAHKSKESMTYLGITYRNYGLMFRMGKEWDRALKNLDKALNHLEDDSEHYLEALYQKTRILIEMSNLSGAGELMTEGEKRSQGNEVYSIMFEALRLLTNLNNKTVKDLETKIIPYLIKNRLHMLTIDFCKVLNKHFVKRGYKIRALEMAATIARVREELHEGGVLR